MSAEFAQGVGSVATQPPDMQADYVATKQTAAFAKLSELELEELRLRETTFLDTSSFDQPRTLDSLAAFVRKCMPSIAESVNDPKDVTITQPGSPALIMLTETRNVLPISHAACVPSVHSSRIQQKVPMAKIDLQDLQRGVSSAKDRRKGARKQQQQSKARKVQVSHRKMTGRCWVDSLWPSSLHATLSSRSTKRGCGNTQLHWQLVHRNVSQL